MRNRVTRLLRASAVCLAAMFCAVQLPDCPPAAAAGTTLTVGGSGTYKTVSEAVAAAAKLNPSGENSRVTIAIAPGTYREQLLINTPYLSFVNSDPNGGEVLITWYYGIGYKYYSAAGSGYYNANDARARSAKGIAQRWGTAVRLQQNARYFRAENITFENSFNRYLTEEELADGVEPTGETLTVQRRQGLDVRSKAATERAAAMCVEADCCEFYRCSFLSSQDTLYTQSKAYFKACKIQGNTDYIFGSGDVVFDGCELCFGGYTDNAVGGYITAARQQTLGYLFWQCDVTAAGGMKVGAGCFGRPWRDTAHVLFYQSRLQYEGIIQSAGWTSMSGVSPEQATFREYGTTTASGGGVNTGGRVRGTVLNACDATREQYLGNWSPYYFNSGGTPLKNAETLDSAERYVFRNAASGLYLAADGALSAGTNIVQRDRKAAAVWTLREAGAGYYYLCIAQNPELHLDLDYGRPDDGTNIHLYTDNGEAAQQFKFVSAGSGVYEIVTRPTSDQSCLTVENASQSPDANVLQMTCGDSDAQRWYAEIDAEPIQGTLIRDLTVFDRKNAAGWSIVPQAVSGAEIFGDRSFTYVGMPAELDGAEYIRTACDSKKTDAELAAFTAAVPVTVYAAMDQRVTPLPAWLSGWSRTGTELDSSNGEHFICYAREFAAGETVRLGTNGMSGTCVNYTVFVRQNAPETTAAETTAATESSTEAVLSEVRGDADCNGALQIADCVLLARYLAEDAVQITVQGLRNAETDGDASALTASDLSMMLQALAGRITL